MTRPLRLVASAIEDSLQHARGGASSAIAVVERYVAPLDEDRQGIAISTFGKVIKRGWDWLGLTPSASSRVGGLVEAPDLAAALTLSKNDFIRTGPRGAAYLAYRKARSRSRPRATASRSAGYHIALTVTLALAPLAVGPAGEHAFITQFLAHWGGASGKRPRR